MTVPPLDPIRPYREGSDAVGWFRRLRGGGEILDAHQTIIADAFGSSIDLKFRSAIDPDSGHPIVLVVEVMAAPDDDNAWAKFLQVQELLLRLEDDFRGKYRLRRPYGRVVVTLANAPDNWDSIAAAAEGDE